MSERFADAAERLAGAAGAVLGWSPDAFWRATPAEMATAVRGLAGGARADAEPPSRALLASMRERFPDG